jgi:protein gp37
MKKGMWWDRTWNPVSGCSPISEGCEHCWAKRMSKRLAGRFGYPADNPFAVTLHPDKLDDPLHWRKPQRIFVCSMSDLFHEDVPTTFLDDIFARMWVLKHHQFIVLTKRPQDMQDYCTSLAEKLPVKHSGMFLSPFAPYWPFPNVTLMVTAENQRRADERIPVLLQTPAAVRGVSLEPLLSPIGLARLFPSAHGMRNDRFQILCGAETGPRARPMQLDWARRVRDDCVEAGIPFWFKADSQGNHQLDGQVWEQLPEIPT